MRPPKWFGRGLPYLRYDDLPGRLITVEGTDRVGRSSQIRLLREWLEIQGYAVLETGWTRSQLMGETIAEAKEGHSLNRWTFTLLYACDFADRLENQVLPALRAGYIVLADRYIYTAIARGRARGLDEAWLRNAFGFALAPDLVVYLKIDVTTLTRRALETGGMDYWEAGMDINPGLDMYDSFRRYQSRLLKEYDAIAGEFGFNVLDARRSIKAIQDQLRAAVKNCLEGAPAAVPLPGPGDSPPPASPAS